MLHRALCAVFSLSLSLSAAVAQEGSGAIDELSKPFGDYTVGDLIPRSFDDSLLEVSETYIAMGEKHRAAVQERADRLKSALKVKQDEIKALKSKAQAAKKEKDLATAGAVEGTIEAETVLVGALKSLLVLTKEQVDFADAMEAYGEALRAYYDAGVAFDPYREKRIERGAGGLSLEGRRALDAEAEAMKDVADAGDDLSKAQRSVLSARVKFLKALEKGGIVPGKK